MYQANTLEKFFLQLLWPDQIGTGNFQHFN